MKVDVQETRALRRLIEAAEEEAARARAQAARDAEKARVHAAAIKWVPRGGCYDDEYYSDDECYCEDSCEDSYDYDPCEYDDLCGRYRFYKKGRQFVPGGGQAPKGGGYY